MINHPLSVGTRIIYDSSVCGCSGTISEGMITNVERVSDLIVYEIDNKKRIPARRVKKIVG